MPALMANIIFDEKAQRDRFIVADCAACIEALRGNVIHHGGKNLVLHFPPIEQSLPCLAGITVGGHPGILRILRSGIGAIRGGAHKTLAVVGRRIEQVSDNLFAGPSAFAPGRVG